MVLWGIWKRVAAVSGFLSGFPCIWPCSFVLAWHPPHQILGSQAPLPPSHFILISALAQLEFQKPIMRLPSATSNIAVEQKQSKSKSGDDDDSNMAHNKQ